MIKSQKNIIQHKVSQKSRANQQFEPPTLTGFVTFSAKYLKHLILNLTKQILLDSDGLEHTAEASQAFPGYRKC